VEGWQPGTFGEEMQRVSENVEGVVDTLHKCGLASLVIVASCFTPRNKPSVEMLSLQYALGRDLFLA
jgi:hypothetical protein